MLLLSIYRGWDTLVWQLWSENISVKFTVRLPYLCSQCLSPLKLWVRTPWGILDTTLCELSLSVTSDRSVVISEYSTSKTYPDDIPKILLKVGLNTIKKLNHTCTVSAYHHWSCEMPPSSLWGVLDTTLCDKDYQWPSTDWSLSPSTPPIKLTATICLKYCWKWRWTPLIKL